MTERQQPRAGMLMWDWKGQPDLTALGELVHQLSGGTVRLYAVDDPGTDDIAVVVATCELDSQAVRDCFEQGLSAAGTFPIGATDGE